MKKKLITLGLAALSVIVFAACSDEGKSIQQLKLNKYLELGEYKGLQIVSSIPEVTDAQVEAEMSSIVKNSGYKIGIKTGTAKLGDTCNIDFVGYVDDIAFDGGTASSQKITLGEGRYIPGFEDGIVGMQPGETKDVNVTFPTEYTEELAGKDAVFRITLNYIIPEISDSVVAALEDDNYSNMAEMKDYIREKLEKDYEADVKNDIGAQALSKAVENATFREVPEYLVEAQKEQIYKNYSSVETTYNITVDEYVSVIYGITTTELAERYIKQRMVAQAIATKEGLDISEEEVNQKLELAAAESGLTTEGYLMVNNLTVDYYREYLLNARVCDFLYDNNMAVQ